MAPDRSALLVIDVQKGFDDPKWGKRNNPSAEENIRRLIKHWRRHGRPIIFVQHDSREPGSPLRPGAPGHAFKEEIEPLESDPVFHKSVNSAFIGTGLESFLREHGFDQLVFVGLTTDHCVSTSTRMAANLGFETTVVADATATFEREGIDGRLVSAEDIHLVELASLKDEFARIAATDELLN